MRVGRLPVYARSLPLACLAPLGHLPLASPWRFAQLLSSPPTLPVWRHGGPRAAAGAQEGRSP
eukprot:5799032-Lingulodinium_polyedra.AAC.1